jgi:hypothetical protein
MPLFGKERVHEMQAALQFLQQLRSKVFSNWPAICETLSKSINLGSGKPNFAKYADNEAAAFEFYLAIVAMQMRAIKTLLPSDQAARIHEHIDRFLEAIPPDTQQSLLHPSELYLDRFGFEVEGDNDWDEVNESTNTSRVLKIFNTYIHAFNGLIESKNPAIRGPAYFLCRRLDLMYHPSAQQYGDGLVHPLLSAAVFRMMADIGGAWWQEYLRRHNVISDRQKV